MTTATLTIGYETIYHLAQAKGAEARLAGTDRDEAVRADWREGVAEFGMDPADAFAFKGFVIAWQYGWHQGA